MKKYIALLLTLCMCFALAACGGAKETAKTDGTAAGGETAGGATAAPAETEAAAAAEPKEVSIGDTITLDFVEITLQKTGVAADIQQSVKKDNVTRTTGPSPLDGQQYVYLTGTIKNLASTELPVYDFFAGEFKLDDYSYKASANQCNITDAEGNPVSAVPPLTTYIFTIYAAVPDELAGKYSQCTFRFGFYDMFDNTELSKNVAFESDPISLCQYYYSVKLK